MSYEAWQVWGKRPEVEATLAGRASGELDEMQCTQQLVKLISEVYKPGMRILDVGCNVGHYLRGIRRLDPQVEYKGVDAYEYYVNQAKEFYAKDAKASFEVKDVMKPIFPQDQYDIVYCCNVILHLPFFKKPVKNLIDSAKKYVFIRTTLGPITTVVKRVDFNKFDEEGEPTDFIHENTYNTEYFVDYVKSLGCDVEVIDDEYDPTVISKEYTTVKKGDGVRILDGKQIDGNIVLEWKFLKITKKD